MVDREKVIDDLEEQIAWIRDNDFHKFPGWGHTVLAMLYALKLLKPRVMTLEDAGKEEVCWIERKSGKVEACRITVNQEDNIVKMERFGMPNVYVPTDFYGEVWRCWNRRPTDAQRDDTPWL